MGFISKLYCYTQTCFCWRSQRGQISKPIIGQIAILLDSEHSPPELLPEELVEKILGRLPLKDIFRFKVVCKSWLKLISGPFFLNNYVRNSPFTLIFRARRLSFSLLEFASGEGTHIPLLSPKLPDLAPSSRLNLIGGGGSCDGSVFILHTKHFNPPPFFFKRTVRRVYLFNPVSGSCAKISPDDTRAGEGEVYIYKVGFVPSINTYKLVRFVDCGFFLKNPEILTVGLDENWRKLDDFGPLACCHVRYFQVICFDGAHHWFSDADADKISTFDLLEEKTGTIPLPRGVSRRQCHSRLTMLNGRLSVAECSAPATLVIWTMREYGVAASWSRLVVLMLGGPADVQCWRRNDYGLVPTAVLANGDILFADRIRGGAMWFFDLQHKRLSQIFDTPDDSSDSYMADDYEYTYVPTFHS